MMQATNVIVDEDNQIWESSHCGRMTLLYTSRIMLVLLGLVFCLVNPRTSAERVSSWPEGQYGLPKPIDDCPKSSSFTWETGSLFQDCEDTNPQTSRSPSFHLAGYVKNDVFQEFCVKTNTINDSANPPWPSGQYCIYQKGEKCPRGLESGWVVWDDESEVIGRNKNSWNGTLPKGKYDRNTKMYFCCSTKGRKTKEIDLPLASPFFLIAYRGSSCQGVRGATATREFIYYETEYYTLVTKNDYGGASPYQVTRSRYGHTIYYCYYRPKYCPSLSNFLNGHVYPPRCGQVNSNVFNDTCTARCNPGYIPRDSFIPVSVCGENGRWNSTPVATCLPIPTTTSPTTRQNTPRTQPHTSNISTTRYSSTESHHQTGVDDRLTTLRQSNQSDHSTVGPSVINTKDGEQDFRTEALAEDQLKLTSVGRIIAGSISGAVVVFGVIFIICVSLCRRGGSKKKETERKRALALDKSKSLEELVTGRGVMHRSVSEENLIYADPVSCQVEYTVKTDENPLYESYDCSTLSNPPDRKTDNILYESVSPLLPSFTATGQNELPPFNYHPTTL